MENKKIKFQNIFLVVFGIWFIDFIFTAIILNTKTGFEEATKLPAYFFSFGFFGWVFCFIFTTLSLFCLSILIYKSSIYAVKNCGEKHGKLVHLVGVGTFFILELGVILKNIWLVYL